MVKRKTICSMPYVCADLLPAAKRLTPPRCKTGVCYDNILRMLSLLALVPIIL